MQAGSATGDRARPKALGDCSSNTTARARSPSTRQVTRPKYAGSVRGPSTGGQYGAGTVTCGLAHARHDLTLVSEGSWAGWARNEMAEDPYKVLGVARDAPDEEIRRAYRKLAKQLHP